MELRHRSLAVAVILAAVASPAFAGAPDLGAHPRIFLRNNGLAQLKAKAAIPGSATARSIATCDDVIAHPDQYSSGGYMGIYFIQPFSACALTWVVRGDQASGTVAVKYFNVLLDDFNTVGDG